ncbi:unnamed protein product [Heligmosomoides polygyrus]|uniref:t-SNARE coiled-coil homology domain-containing protein n=1 Tax=Heligmosomoides polygyrus TaxID=6339 RepID=A0A183G811_HELPZ|nr:unnamed protein product [Heligmosomoides polygyrus]
MSTIGATKAQITKTVNTLRKALEEAERQLAPAPDGGRVSPDESTRCRREFNINYHAQYIRSLIKRLEDRWEGAHALAEGQTSLEEEASVLGDLQSHWDANACDQLMADAKRLLARVNGRSG